MRARRLDGDADRLDDREVPAGVRGAHRERGAPALRAVGVRAGRARCAGGRGGGVMPDRQWITFTIDGVEVSAPEGEWLVDAAKRGDVEIPFFCYEPKLGHPVGACRMCMVEIEGIPKLQTSCSTPVKDGMVVYTQTNRVKEAPTAVVGILLVTRRTERP